MESFSGHDHLPSRQGLSVVFSSLIRLKWLASEAQASSCQSSVLLPPHALGSGDQSQTLTRLRQALY